jgi:predicted nucleic acid-binding protein
MSDINYFIDTSALFKRYINEPGTSIIDGLFQKIAIFFISNLTIVEFISNLKRLLEIGRAIDNNTFITIKRQFFKDIDDGRMRIAPLSSLNIITAVDLISEKYITPIDALQLATALNLQGQSGKIVFVCADLKLCNLAEKNGLEVIAIN